jgi:hypothetical protein
VDEVGEKSSVLMGLSQGRATVLISALLWEGESLGAVIGMCGCLSFATAMSDAFAHDPEDDSLSATIRITRGLNWTKVLLVYEMSLISEAR